MQRLLRKFRSRDNETTNNQTTNKNFPSKHGSLLLPHQPNSIPNSPISLTSKPSSVSVIKKPKQPNSHENRPKSTTAIQSNKVYPEPGKVSNEGGLYCLTNNIFIINLNALQKAEHELDSLFTDRYIVLDIGAFKTCIKENDKSQVKTKKQGLNNKRISTNCTQDTKFNLRTVEFLLSDFCTELVDSYDLVFSLCCSVKAQLKTDAENIVALACRNEMRLKRICACLLLYCDQILSFDDLFVKYSSYFCSFANPFQVNSSFLSQFVLKRAQLMLYCYSNSPTEKNTSDSKNVMKGNVFRSAHTRRFFNDFGAILINNPKFIVPKLHLKQIRIFDLPSFDDKIEGSCTLFKNGLSKSKEIQKRKGNSKQGEAVRPPPNKCRLMLLIIQENMIIYSTLTHQKGGLKQISSSICENPNDFGNKKQVNKSSKSYQDNINDVDIKTTTPIKNTLHTLKSKSAGSSNCITPVTSPDILETPPENKLNQQKVVKAYSQQNLTNNKKSQIQNNETSTNSNNIQSLDVNHNKTKNSLKISNKKKKLHQTVVDLNIDIKGGFIIKAYHIPEKMQTTSPRTLLFTIYHHTASNIQHKEIQSFNQCETYQKDDLLNCLVGLNSKNKNFSVDLIFSDSKPVSKPRSSISKLDPNDQELPNQISSPSETHLNRQNSLPSVEIIDECGDSNLKPLNNEENDEMYSNEEIFNLVLQQKLFEMTNVDSVCNETTSASRIVQELNISTDELLARRLQQQFDQEAEAQSDSNNLLTQLREAQENLPSNIDPETNDYEDLIDLQNYMGNCKRHRTGASKRLISSLPAFCIKNSSCKQIKSKSQCSICRYGFKVGDMLRTLPCIHHYHKTCIDNWLRINKKCPVCHTFIDDPNMRALI